MARRCVRRTQGEIRVNVVFSADPEKGREILRRCRRLLLEWAMKAIKEGGAECEGCDIREGLERRPGT